MGDGGLAKSGSPAEKVDLLRVVLGEEASEPQGELLQEFFPSTLQELALEFIN